MRNRGIDAGPELFEQQLDCVMAFLSAVDLTERGNNYEYDASISEVVAITTGMIERFGGVEGVYAAAERAVARLRNPREAQEEGEEEEDTGEIAGEEEEEP